mgnify:FL=1|jgi:hypothetical protein|tara:strand:- start:751 stop:1029 length:279 start_codon:yes stop_codon:yes gene_type:complete
MARSIKLEYERHGSKPAEKKKRAARNTARRRAIRSGKIKKGSSMDVHHKDGNPKNNSQSNLVLVPRSQNRNKSPGRPKGKKDGFKRRPRGKV